MTETPLLRELAITVSEFRHGVYQRGTSRTLRIKSAPWDAVTCVDLIERMVWHAVKRPVKRRKTVDLSR